MAESNGAATEVKDVEMNNVEVKKAISPTLEVADLEAIKSDVNGKPTATEVKVVDKTENTSSNDPPSSLEKQLIRQIEYYFGDVNLPRDKFLLEQVKLDDGWVPLDVMFKFKRLASLSTDPDIVLAALAKSTEKLMEVSEDKKKIRRSPNNPLPIMNEERRKELLSRTLYVKGFPVKDITLDDVLEYFAPYGPVENVQMRSYKDRATSQAAFKGSVFALFKTTEGAKKFLELESVKYEETELIRKWQVDYMEEKRKERDAKKSKGKNDTSPVKEKEPVEQQLPKGCVIHIKGLEEGNTITREQIKAQLVKLGAEVAYIEFPKGSSELWVRFHKENSAKNMVSEHMADGTYTLCDCEVEVRLLEGDEEETFLTKTKQDIAKLQKHQGRHRGNQRGRGRGGRGGNRGGRGGRGQKRRSSPGRDEGSQRKKLAV